MLQLLITFALEQHFTLALINLKSFSVHLNVLPALQWRDRAVLSHAAPYTAGK